MDIAWSALKRSGRRWAQAAVHSCDVHRHRPGVLAPDIQCRKFDPSAQYIGYCLNIAANVELLRRRAARHPAFHSQSEAPASDTFAENPRVPDTGCCQMRFLNQASPQLVPSDVVSMFVRSILAQMPATQPHRKLCDFLHLTSHAFSYSKLLHGSGVIQTEKIIFQQRII